MKKYYVLGFIILIFFIGTYYLFNTNDVKIEYGKSEIYSKEDIELAIKVVDKEFAKFPNCKMISIKYAGDDISAQELINGYDECIVIYSSFHTGKYNTEAFEPDTEYKKWSWILCRKNGKDWILVNNGIG